MQIITLILAALFVYLLFSRKGGMGMGCCGSHGSITAIMVTKLLKTNILMSCLKMETRTSSTFEKINIP